MPSPKKTLEQIRTELPLGKVVEFSPGRGAPKVRAVITGHRQAGEPGTKGHSVFVETHEDRGKLKGRDRSVRAGTCTLVS